jgi:ferredoxin/nitroreductase
MAIPTSRTRENGQITIDESKCNGCGLCVEVCKDFSFQIINKKVALTNNSLFGCIACGHCMAICPTGAIDISGRELSADDLFKLPAKETAASYDSLLNLLKSRRSIREFTDKPIDSEIIQKILAAASTAPMGIPPSDVHLLILDNRERVRIFAEDFCHFLQSMKWFVADWFLLLMRPFWGKSNDEMARKFIKPLIHIYTDSMNKGTDLVTYDAPLAIYFYGSPFTDPADPIIAATYAMIAGESLGLGTCMLGAIHPFIQYGGKSRKFREKYGIKFKSSNGLFVIFGYPKVNYKKGIKRTFASIECIS